MGSFQLRTVLRFELDDDSKWFTDKKLVATLVDAVLATDLARSITHAGVMSSEKPVKTVEAMRKALVVGKALTVTALDGPAANRSSLSINLDLATDQLRTSIVIGGAPLEERRATLLASIESIAIAQLAAMRPLGGLALGFSHPQGADFEFPRVRPPTTHRRYEVSALIDFLDLTFHRGDNPAARPDEIKALAAARLPVSARRTEHDGLVIVRWIPSLEDDRAVAIAAGRHEQWMAGAIKVERSSLYNEQGDLVVDLSERVKRAPFTMYDADEDIGYKAIIVDPRGRPDDEVWSEMAAVLARPGKVKGIRLIVPKRQLAIGLAQRAKTAGFDAVLYPGADDRLWNPQPEGWWIDELPGEPPAKPASKRR